MFEEGILVCHRSVIKGGESLSRLFNALTDLYGQGTDVDHLEERLIFKPMEQSGNMNFINKDSLMIMHYEKNRIVVQHVVSSLPSGKPLIEVLAVRQSGASNLNLRRMLIRSGFRVKSDFAKKGLQFNTRHDGIEVILTRPYNCELKGSSSYESGIPAWNNLGGSFPFGSDYLIELKKMINNQSELDACIQSITDLHSKLVAIAL
jgi:hypothetical protein